MSKAVRPRKRSIKENRFQVTMVPQGAAPAAHGQPPDGQTTVDVTGTNPVDAVKQAMQSTGGDKVDSVTVMPGSTTQAKPGQPGQPIQPKPGVAPVIPMESFKRAKYPYNILLPMIFEDVIRKATISKGKKLNENWALARKSGGQISISVHTAEALSMLVARLEKSRDARAKIVLEGIKRTL